MSLLSVLKKIGKDFSDVEKWVVAGLAVTSLVDPPLAPILAVVEKILDALPKGTPVTATLFESLVTATATVQGVTCVCSCCGCQEKK
jgi:hypothetical protein